MITEIYIAGESFRYKETVPEYSIIDKIEEFASDCDLFRANGDCLLKHNSIYSIELFKDHPIAEELYGDHAKRKLNRDQRSALRKIIEYSQSTEDPIESIISILDENSQDVIRGIYWFNYVRCVDVVNIISSKSDWYSFHRYYLAKYTISELYFYNECAKYFPNLFFHPNVELSLSSLEPDLQSMSYEIIRNLSLLNDKFKVFHIQNNRVKTLSDFSSGTGLDASTEGNASRKPAFTFCFSYNSGKEIISENICCEPHLKLHKSDNPGDTKYYFNRIYFHEGKNHIHRGKILVGHIGQHL